MGLYLCVFEENNELDGVEVGSYADFNCFRDSVSAAVESGDLTIDCSVLINHSDSDGEWSSNDASLLIAELTKIEEAFKRLPPIEFNSEWKYSVAKTFGIISTSLLDCFFDIDGEQLVERLRSLAQLSVSTGQPILFQ